MILVLDNRDSFVHNLARYVRELGEEAVVRRSDEMTLDEVGRLAPSHVIISPGPCTPAEAGISTDVVRRFGSTTPILGVCLGHQCIGAAYGGEIVRASRPVHGRTSLIEHDNSSVFEGLPSPLRATRYHSLVIARPSMPESLRVVATAADDREIMAVVHRSDPKHTELTFPLFEKELRQHIIPVVDKAYSTQPGPNGRAIAGLSMGGRHAQLVGFKSLDLFRSFGILSAGDPESEKSTPEFLNDPAINQKVDYLFVGLGTHENQPTNRSVVFHQILEKHHVAHDYYVGGDGGHDWGTWRAHLVYMLPKLWRTKSAQKTSSSR